MSKTTRKFRGKAYRQGYEPCELELTRKRAEKKEAHIREALRQAAYEEQQAMGYDQYPGLKIFIDGDMWCVLFGDDLQSGVAGFGATREEAWDDFVNNMMK